MITDFGSHGGVENVGIRDFANAAGDVPTVRRDLRARVKFYSGEISLISESESLSGQPRLSESR